MKIHPKIPIIKRNYIIKGCQRLDSSGHNHKNAHGFMITDTDNPAYPCYINCVFENNDGTNCGAGLYID